MSFANFPEQHHAVEALQRSLERNRLAHAYLFIGRRMEPMEGVARALAKTLNCLAPPVCAEGGLPSDCCDTCDSCHRIDAFNHPDTLWVRPESKSRVITIEQVRDLMQSVNLKPSAGRYKVSVICGADRLNSQAANAFLKTLEEPPARSVLVLLTTDPQHVLETILSRCLRIAFAEETLQLEPQDAQWLSAFGDMAAKSEHGLLSRYRLLGLLLARLAEQKTGIEKELSAGSPLEKYDDLDPKTRERFESELNAGVEAEYRRRRAELIGSIQWWLRDVWIESLGMGGELLNLPNLGGAAKTIARRITPSDARQNLEIIDRLIRQLESNVQEALALEVGLLKLKL
jgi:DNA polymerase-3 subunit delta'